MDFLLASELEVVAFVGGNPTLYAHLLFEHFLLLEDVLVEHSLLSSCLGCLVGVIGRFFLEELSEHLLVVDVDDVVVLVLNVDVVVLAVHLLGLGALVVGRLVDVGPGVRG